MKSQILFLALTLTQGLAPLPAFAIPCNGLELTGRYYFEGFDKNCDSKLSNTPDLRQSPSFSAWDSETKEKEFYIVRPGTLIEVRQNGCQDFEARLHETDAFGNLFLTKTLIRPLVAKSSKEKVKVRKEALAIRHELAGSDMFGKHLQVHQWTYKSTKDHLELEFSDKLKWYLFTVASGTWTCRLPRVN